MQVLNGIAALRELPPGAALSIGNFDGLHRGHSHILSIGRSMRDAGQATSLAVATFEPHPLTVLRPEMAPPRLSPSRLKQELLAEAGVDHVVVLSPEPAVLNLSAEEFFQILRDDTRPAALIEGATFTFGKGRGGNINRLREWSATTAIKLHIAEPQQAVLLDLSVVDVNSTLIRWLVAHGRARDAAICIGRAYALEGTVVKGFQRGRTIGIPTANLNCGDQLLPADGVYAASCAIGGRDYPVALSVGRLPTFRENVLQVEAHIIGFDGDLYGQTLRVALIDWLRDQWKFDGVNQLKTRIARDIALCRHLANRNPAQPLAKL